MGKLVTIKKYLWLISLSGLLSLSTADPSQAEEIPEQVNQAIEGIERAANQQNLRQLLQFYSQEFSNTDGLRYETLATALERLWGNYPNLKYEIILESWSKEGEEIVAETTTNISGVGVNQGQTQEIKSIIRSRQYFQGNQLIRQEIISEETDVTSGNPAEISVIVNSQVQAHEQFNFDLIVQEPLENGMLLGSAIEEETRSDRYLQPSNFEIAPLPSGGIFKLVTAPALPGAYWLSGIIIDGNGSHIVTRRVTVEAR
ncbi:MAG: nuclear transport factor 2 family protein [Gloeocapsa sp. DLM2.Bin57]|nr:MAG: nuclear transport factor 2 family protein [Gloeocapsa sp. DLM2.Bin57]